MAYKQLKKPNVNILTKAIGYCLWWTQQAFGSIHKYDFAIDEWKANTYNHKENPPKGVWTPIFFTMRGEPAGHVAISAPDGSIYSTSSPYSLKPVHHKNMQDLLHYYGGRLTYLGWSEDIGGVRVVAPVTPVIKKIIAKVSPSKPVKKPVRKSETQIAKEIVAGKGGWGNGPVRVQKLKKAGYNPARVQAIVNKLVR